MAKELTKKLSLSIQDKCRIFGLDYTKTVVDILDYIIGILDPTGKPIEGWSHTEEENIAIRELMMEYVKEMGELLTSEDWFDAWGDLFMSMASGTTSLKGQFFTPDSLSGLCASLLGESLPEATQRTRFGRRLICNDPTCGSSRMLLAANSHIHKCTGRLPYLVGEDIDMICCKMSAVNLAIHCCYGEIVCHDSLCFPDQVRVGYIINEGLWPDQSGLPTIRRSTNPEDFVACSIWKGMAQRNKKQEELLLFG